MKAIRQQDNLTTKDTKGLEIYYRNLRDLRDTGCHSRNDRPVQEEAHALVFTKVGKRRHHSDISAREHKKEDGQCSGAGTAPLPQHLPNDRAAISKCEHIRRDDADTNPAPGRRVTVVVVPDELVVGLNPLPVRRDEIEVAFAGWQITDVEPSFFKLPPPLEWVLRPDEHWYRLRRG